MLGSLFTLLYNLAVSVCFLLSFSCPFFFFLFFRFSFPFVLLLLPFRISVELSYNGNASFFFRVLDEKWKPSLVSSFLYKD